METPHLLKDPVMKSLMKSIATAFLAPATLYAALYAAAPSAAEEIPADWNRNQRIDIGDTVREFQMAVGFIEPTPEQVEAGDFDGSGRISLSDVGLLQWYLIGWAEFEGQPAPDLDTPCCRAASPNGNLTAEFVPGESLQEAYLMIRTDERASRVAGFVLTLKYGPPYSLEPREDDGPAEINDPTKPPLTQFIADGSGRMVTVTTRPQHIGPNEEVFRLKFSVEDGGPPPEAPPLELIRVTASDEEGQLIDLGLTNLHAATQGDLNGNGIVEITDATLALQASLRLVSLTPQQVRGGDLIADGKIDLKDATQILRKAIGL